MNEKDESRYQSWQHLEPADGWKWLDLDLATFTLADDSKDENAFDIQHGVPVCRMAGLPAGGMSR